MTRNDAAGASCRAAQLPWTMNNQNHFNWRSKVFESVFERQTKKSKKNLGNSSFKIGRKNYLKKKRIERFGTWNNNNQNNKW